MKKENSTFWIVTIIVSVGIGSFVLSVLETTKLNVWLSRIIGCTVTVIIELGLHYFLIVKNKK